MPTPLPFTLPYDEPGDLGLDLTYRLVAAETGTPYQRRPVYVAHLSEGRFAGGLILSRPQLRGLFSDAHIERLEELATAEWEMTHADALEPA